MSGLKINCTVCEVLLTEPGGLFFTAPTDNLGQDVVKLHLCCGCTADVEDFIAGKAGEWVDAGGRTEDDEADR